MNNLWKLVRTLVLYTVGYSTSTIVEKRSKQVDVDSKEHISHSLVSLLHLCSIFLLLSIPHQQPMIFCIENNHYGMGRSILIVTPPLLIITKWVTPFRESIREGTQFAKEYSCGAGNGPIYIEMMNYCYHRHSISDPGTTYPNREEIEFTRSTRDPLEFIKTCLIEAEFMTAEEIKEKEKAHSQGPKEIVKAKESPRSNLEDMFKHMHAADLTPGNKVYSDYICMPDMAKSKWFNDKLRVGSRYVTKAQHCPTPKDKE
jgi:hypothetical protein